MTRTKDLALLRETSPESAASALYRARKRLKVHVRQGPIETVRKARYHNHQIEIRTIYDIRIDGRRVTGHIELGNDGRLQYHGLPAYGWGSAVDMCEELIDSFPEDFPRKGKAPRKPVKPATKYKRGKKKAAKTTAKRTTKRRSSAGKGR